MSDLKEVREDFYTQEELSAMNNREKEKYLSQDQKLDEWVKCLEDPIYFIKEYCYVGHPDPKRGKIRMGENMYEKQEYLLRTVHENRFTITSKTRQCLTEDNFVMTTRGYISIKDVQVGDKIETLVNNKKKFVRVLDSFYNGHKPTYKITTICGKQVDCTFDHKIFTKRGWVEAGDLVLEDEIACTVEGTRKGSFTKIKEILDKKIKEDVYDITTESSDFLANGLLVHNCGASTVLGLYALWYAQFNEGIEICVISRKDGEAKEFKRRYVDFPYKELPEFLKSKNTKGSKKLTESAHTRTFDTGSLIKCEAGPNAGRGGTYSFIIIDEAGFVPHIEETWSAIYSTLNVGKGKGVVNSTSSAIGTWYANMWHEAVDNREQGKVGPNDFHPVEIEWFDVPYYRDEPDWLETQRKNLKPEAKFRREVLREFIVEGDTFIPQDKIDILETKQPLRTDFIMPDDTVDISEALSLPEEWFSDDKNYAKGFYVWKEPERKHKYILAADVSTGASNDFSTIQVIDSSEPEQVAEYRGKLDTNQFSRLIYKVASYYNMAHVVIEYNSIGAAVFNELDYHMQYENLYFRPQRKPGWLTNSATRDEMLNSFYNAVVHKSCKINSKRLKQEIINFILHNGKPQAASGTNDDLIMAFAIAVHLSEVYLINSYEYNMQTDSTPFDIDNKEDMMDESVESLRQKLEELTGYSINMNDYYNNKWMF